MTSSAAPTDSKIEPFDQGGPGESAQPFGNRSEPSRGRAIFRSGYGGVSYRTKSAENQTSLPEGAGYLSRTHAAVRPLLTTATELKDFRLLAGELLLSERRLIVDQALILLEQNYVHLPLKKAIHAVDPVQRLKLLKFQLAEMRPDQMTDELRFHDEILEIFNSVRDYHTRYALPSPYNGSTAFLPFLVEEYFDQEGTRRYLVSHVLKDFGGEYFESGVELLYWNGIAIERAIRLNGENQPGNNADARFAGGLDALTIRPMISSLPPDEEWVTLTYRSLDGAERELRQRWLVIPSGTMEEELREQAQAHKGATKMSVNLEKAIINEFRKVLFAPQAVAAQNRIAEGKARFSHVKPNEIETTMPDTFRAREVKTPNGVFAYIRIFTFLPPEDDVDAFVAEFQRLLGLLPQNGLIVDVRNNGGGFVDAGERLLQFLTPEKIEPETFEFINTPLNLALCRVAAAEEELNRWSKSIAESVLTGATYSIGFPLTSKDECNNTGQIYTGPVVLITDALCYSTTDIFAAGFQDHSIGLILGTSRSTGAGGANVWGHEDLLGLLSAGLSNPLEQLPKDVGLRVAIRRSRRIGERAGTPLEEFGVTSDEVHRMTRRDVLQGNTDLVNHAAEVLSRLSVEVMTDADGMLTADITTKNITRVEVTLDGEKKSLDVRDGKVQFNGRVSPFVRSILRLRGFELRPDDEHLVAVRNLGIHPNPEISSTRGALQMVHTSKKGGSKTGSGSTTSNKGGGGKKGSTKKGTSKKNTGSKQGSGSAIGAKGGKKGSTKKGSTKKGGSKSGSGSTTSNKGGTKKKR